MGSYGSGAAEGARKAAFKAAHAAARLIGDDKTRSCLQREEKDALRQVMRECRVSDVQRSKRRRVG